LKNITEVWKITKKVLCVIQWFIYDIFNQTSQKGKLRKSGRLEHASLVLQLDLHELSPTNSLNLVETLDEGNAKFTAPHS